MRDKDHSNNKSEYPELVYTLDYYLDNGKWVFTEHYLKKRGYCCTNGCKHCPYKNKKITHARGKGNL